MMFSFIAWAVVGIDLCMMNSSISVMEEQQAWVIETFEGARTAPSMVAFTKHDKHLVSSPAKCQAIVNLSNIIFT